jgi:hypothetical protein
MFPISGLGQPTWECQTFAMGSSRRAGLGLLGAQSASTRRRGVIRGRGCQWTCVEITASVWANQLQTRWEYGSKEPAIQ